MTNINIENRQLILDYFDLTFNQHKPAQAAELFLSADYMHHGPGCGSGREEFILFFSQFFKEKPFFTAKILHCIADTEYVSLRVATQNDPTANVIEVAEFYRVKGKKIIEHWHVISAESTDNHHNSSTTPA